MSLFLVVLITLKYFLSNSLSFQTNQPFAELLPSETLALSTLNVVSYEVNWSGL